jgi:hypothetical protein
MSSSLAGATGYPGGASSTGSKLRGLDPRMKHISGAHRFQQFTPEQMDLFQQLLGLTGSENFLSKLAGGDEEAFNQMEAPALRQFSGLQGNLASRFSGMGMGARKSSGFTNTANAAASDFAQGLQSQRTGLQRQSLMDLAQISQMLLGQEPYGLSTRQKQPSFLESLVGGGALGSLGSAAINKFF